MKPAVPAIGRILAGLWVLLLVGLLHGWLAFGNYLINEHRRLVWYEIGLMWTSDVIALFWFLSFCVQRQFDRSDDLEEDGAVRGPASLRIVLFSLVLGMVAELALAMEMMRDEFVAFQRAVPAACQVTSVRSTTANGAPTYWKLDGSYSDGAGNRYPVSFYVRERNDLSKLPQPVVQRIHQRQLPMELRIVYDPVRPSRNWIHELGWDDQNRLHYMSLAILVFQFLFTALFIVLLQAWIKEKGQLPWWSELHRVLPLACEAGVMALIGGVELYLVRRLCL